MTKTNIPPIEEAWKLAEGLRHVIKNYIEIVTINKQKAKDNSNVGEVNRNIGKIEAYTEVLRLMNEYNIKRT
jgi:hypothetical protein